MQNLKSLRRRGAAMVEYAVLLGAVTLVGLIGISVLGHKTNDLVAALAVLLPGAHEDDDFFLSSGALIETSADASGVGRFDITDIGGGDSERLVEAVGLPAGSGEILLPE